MIVQYQEVANRLDVGGKDAVELFGGFRVAISRRKQRQEFCDTALYQVNARRFQRLEETARQADGDDVLVPRFATPAGKKANQAGLGQRLLSRWASKVSAASASLQNLLL